MQGYLSPIGDGALTVDLRQAASYWRRRFDGPRQFHAGGFKRYEGLLPFGLRRSVRGSHAFIPEKLIRCFSHLICRFNYCQSPLF